MKGKKGKSRGKSRKRKPGLRNILPAAAGALACVLLIVFALRADSGSGTGDGGGILSALFAGPGDEDAQGSGSSADGSNGYYSSGRGGSLSAYANNSGALSGTGDTGSTAASALEGEDTDYMASWQLPEVALKYKDDTGVDFDSLTSLNTDIYAWLEIPGSGISYPVMQSGDDDTWYLAHAYDGSEEIGGGLFTEGKYNGKDFADRVTVINGSAVPGGCFAWLQALYSEPEGFASHATAMVYLPDRTFEYTAFAAVPYGDDSLMSRFGFESFEDVTRFLNIVYSMRAIDVHQEDIALEEDDRLLVLAAPLMGDSSQRYLVLYRQEG